MAQVFTNVYGNRFETIREFLDYFEAKQCYLDDLSYVPIDNLQRSERRQVISSCVNPLAERMKEYQPEHVVIILKSIEASVIQAAELAKIKSTIHAVPFPGQGNQKRFLSELSEIHKAIHEMA